MMNVMPIGIAGNRVCLCVDCGTSLEIKGRRRPDRCQPCNAAKERQRWKDRDLIRKAARAAAGRSRTVYMTEDDRRAAKKRQHEAASAKERELAKRQQKAAHVMAYRAWIKEREQEQAEIRRQERSSLPRKPWNEPGLADAEKWRIRYKLDPEFNIRQRVRLFDRKAKTGRYGEAMRAALKNNRTSPTIERSLGYTIADLKRHLERQFTKGMTWDKFCAASIHIDHIIPLASFDLADPEQMRAAWAMTNLRPMWATDNIKKSSKRQLLL